MLTPEIRRPTMPMNASEREIVADLISAVRTLASQVLTLHLQLGAMRTLLVTKGVMSEGELTDVLTKLEATSAADALLDRTTPDVDEVFEALLRRLGTD
jgi:hypothetical protein